MKFPRLVLLGCGHAHLFVLEALARGRLGDVRATLISPDENYFYSGMIPGVIAGCYRPEQARFRPRLLAAACGAEFIRDSATGVDAEGRYVRLSDGRRVGFDLLSIDIGSRVSGLETPGVARHAHPVKPMNRALRILPSVDVAARDATPTRPARIVIAGGGAAGTEVAICLDARLRRRTRGAPRHTVTVVDAGDTILAEHPEPVRRRARGVLRRREIEVRSGLRIRAVDPRAIQVADGPEIGYDLLIWATGPSAPALPRDSGLPVDDRGYLRVHPTLRVHGYPSIFAAGDCIAIPKYPGVARAGVYAVRAGPVLARNLRRHLDGREPEEYEPQRHWLALLNTGDGRAILSYRGLAIRGRAPWWLKDRIDRRFMRRFQSLE